MSINLISERSARRVLPVPSGVGPGDPVAFGAFGGVALTNRDASGVAVVELPYETVASTVAVTATGADGASEVMPGDTLYIADGVVSKDVTGVPYGVALAGVAAGATAATPARVGAPGAGPLVYYVDSIGGDDGNSGTSPDAPFETLAAAQTAALAHGNGARIGLARGSEWRESLDLGTLHNVTISGYGEGALPIVNAADLVPDEWEDSTDRDDAFSNTYSISWTHATPPGQSNAGPSLFEDGEMMKWQTSIAAVDANPGSFYHDGATSDESPVTIYVHPTGSTNPNVNDQTYEATKRTWAIRVGNNATVRLVEACNQGHDNGAINAGINAFVNKCVVHGNPAHDALFSSGVYNTVVGWHPYADVRTGAIVLEAYIGEGAGLSALWDKCIVVGPADSSVVGIGGHTSESATRYEHWEVRDSALKNATVKFVDVLTGSVRRVRLRNASVQFYNADADARSYDVIDVWAHLDAPSIINVSRAVWSRQGPNTMNINGLRAYLSNDGVHGVEGPHSIVTGSVGYEIGQTAGLQVLNFIRNSNLAHIAEWHRNIIAMPGEAMINIRGSATATDNVLFSLGRYRLSDGAGGFLTYTTLAAIQATGIESGTLEIDPQLVDPANGDFSTAIAIPNGAGLERPNIEYLPIPTSLAEARTWVLSQ
jgi:hypothetical protein